VRDGLGILTARSRVPILVFFLVSFLVSESVRQAQQDKEKRLRPRLRDGRGRCTTSAPQKRKAAANTGARHRSGDVGER